MKRITYIILVLSAITLTACNDFLEEKQRSALTEEEAYGSLSALKNNAVLSLYNYIGGNTNSQGLQGTGRGVYDLNTMTTDEAITPIRGGDWYDGGFGSTSSSILGDQVQLLWKTPGTTSSKW